MFTGLIEEVGIMQRIGKQGQTMVLSIAAKRIMSDVQLGDSIAINGVCLTVISFDAGSFTVDVMPETFRHTNLSLLSAGDRVNLERAMSAQGRFGGHIVQGHVDATGRITARRPEENAVYFTIELENTDAMKYIVPRGSITIDGISLTVIGVDERSFSVSIIPHTLAQTILQHKQPGASVNIETDLLGKYIERLLFYRGAEKPELASKSGGPAKSSRLTAEFLAENGFL
ncbi:riboflavin synthase [Paenibacillus sp. MBLB4367]|uniref:riboflavin synthase n=1 Tax=Paenibacillus sp. MBLB4367 TaxID=3384767 RepID=UPI0039083A44